MKKINVLNKYDIIIERGLLADCGSQIRGVTKAQTAAIVTDDNVSAFYLETVSRSLNKAGFDVCTFIFPHGEENKNIRTVMEMVDFFAKNGLTRSDIAVALGGGVCGDMCGFAAAIYLRGISFVQIPTSLLAQVDSSVGGKTGCDLDCGKNLVGAFHHPSLVLIDPDTLSTLPEKYMADGMGEVIKYGCIRSKELFSRLLNSENYENIDDIIYECVKIKADIVEKDFTEQNERMLLNFGHTVGHAIEKVEDFCGMSHGMAVGVGMVMITDAAEKEGLTEKGTADSIRALLKKYGMPTETEHGTDDISRAAMSDKKRRSDTLNIVLIKDIGEGYVHKIKCDRLNGFLGGK